MSFLLYTWVEWSTVSTLEIRLSENLAVLPCNASWQTIILAKVWLFASESFLPHQCTIQDCFRVTILMSELKLGRMEIRSCCNFLEDFGGKRAPGGGFGGPFRPEGPPIAIASCCRAGASSSAAAACWCGAETRSFDKLMPISSKTSFTRLSVSPSSSSPYRTQYSVESAHELFWTMILNKL